MTRSSLVVASVLTALLAAAGTCAAQDRYALIVVGAPGGDAYQQQFAALETSLSKAVKERLAFDASRVTVLSGTTTNPSLTSTREHVRAAFDTLRSHVKAGDLVLILLAGHGTSDGATAKFNLVGPDLDASEWADLVAPLQGRLIFVNATGASFPFLEALSRRNRVIVTATDSTAQRFDTVFAEMFAKALEDPATDLDRNGRISVWEAFVQTSAAVAQYFEQHGQLATEHAMLDDNGDRIGRQAEAPGPDGSLARTVYLDADPAALAVDPALAALAARQRSLEEQAEALKLKKKTMPPEQWDAEFEQLMIELARVSRALRQKS
jgi:hypothetical protein